MEHVGKTVDELQRLSSAELKDAEKVMKLHLANLLGYSFAPEIILSAGWIFSSTHNIVHITSRFCIIAGGAACGLLFPVLGAVTVGVGASLQLVEHFHIHPIKQTKDRIEAINIGRGHRVM
jgi:hypothetical protein